MSMFMGVRLLQDLTVRGSQPMYIIKMVSYSQVLLEIKLVQAGKRVKINSNEEILYFSEKGKFHMWA